MSSQLQEFVETVHDTSIVETLIFFMLRSECD